MTIHNIAMTIKGLHKIDSLPLWPVQNIGIIQLILKKSSSKERFILFQTTYLFRIFFQFREYWPHIFVKTLPLRGKKNKKRPLKVSYLSP